MVLSWSFLLKNNENNRRHSSRGMFGFLVFSRRIISFRDVTITSLHHRSLLSTCSNETSVLSYGRCIAFRDSCSLRWSAATCRVVMSTRECRTRVEEKFLLSNVRRGGVLGVELVWRWTCLNDEVAPHRVRVCYLSNILLCVWDINETILIYHYLILGMVF